jgi:single-strand DNA-binding protein
MSYQKITIVGNVGRDAEMAYTRQGIAVLKFSVAVNKTIGKGDDKHQTTTWFNVTLWRERAEALASYIKAGMQVLVMGEVTVSPYIDKTGKPAASLELTADDVKLLTSKQEMDRRANEDDDAPYAEPEPEPRTQPAKSQANANGKAQAPRGKRQSTQDEEIPF